MIIGLGLIQLIQYIFITKGRYEFIRNREIEHPKFGISSRKGMILSIVFGASGLLFAVISILFIHFIDGNF